MEASNGLVAGSHNRNQLVRIRHDSDSGVSLILNLVFFYELETCGLFSLNLDGVFM